MLILAAVVAIFVYGMTAAMLGTILPDLSSRFQLTPRQNGTIAFAQALGLMLASLGVGPLLDDFGKKAGLILGLGLIASRGLAAAEIHRLPQHHLPLFLLGCGGGIVVTGANALTERRWRSAPRDSAQPGEYLLRTGRPRDAVHCGESFQAQLGAPLLQRCRI